MENRQKQFDSSQRRRLVLVADDEAVNRELLGFILSTEYEVLCACDGEQALELVREHKRRLSLVLLDLLMPGVHGLEVLRQMMAEPQLRHIPVIVMTSEQRAEVESLEQGAVDFIPKPYPQPEVILARVQRTIELFEDRQTIESTERDSVTGLYNREYFYRYARQFDEHHREVEMDAMVLDINHFRMINERHGKAYGDEVLRRLGQDVGALIRSCGGLIARRDSDTFLAYCPHGVDHQAILNCALAALSEDSDPKNSRIRIRMGVYPKADKSLDIERRFDRAKVAADTLRNNYIQSVAYYNSELLRAELFAEQLLDGFHDAISQGQFQAYFQPKFDIRSSIPVLTSAEALVRWIHPELGLVSPAEFIPLFENNGLIQELDHCIWRQAAAQVRAWKDRYGVSVPVSVNVSRVDIYDPNVVDHFLNLVQEFQLEPSELLLEITESVYTQDYKQIIDTVRCLRTLGFSVEMDDFGTGYSSLNMLSSLPIDVLKLDMKFIQSAFSERRDIRMLELVIDIADHLGVPVVAEGVETGEQLNVLRAMGCDIVQGYYFSRPLPAREFERFVQDKQAAEQHRNSGNCVDKGTVGVYFKRISHALSNGYESIYYVDARSGEYVEFTSRGKYEDLGLERSGSDFFADAMENLHRVVFEADRPTLARLFQKERFVRELESRGVYTTDYRLLINGVPTYYNLRAVYTPTRTSKNIVIGVSNVDGIARQSRQMQETGEQTIPFSHIAKALARDYFSLYYIDTRTNAYQEYSAVGNHQELKLEKTGEDFFQEVQRTISESVYPPDQEKAARVWNRDFLLGELERSDSFVASYRLLLEDKPVYVSSKVTLLEEEDGKHLVAGVSSIDAQMKREVEFAQAREVSMRDPLTGVKNNRSYAQTEQELNEQIANSMAADFAVVICDVVDLKRINESQGHVAGDQCIREACGIVCRTFSHSPVFRIGGDVFVALLRNGDYERRSELMGLLDQLSYENQMSGKVTMAAGIAEFRRGQDESVAQVYERANGRMFRNKKAQKTKM